MPSRTLSFFLVIALVLITPVFAQTESTTGSINGVVTDSSGGALPGVTVTATNKHTGLTRTAVTEADGTYQMQLLPPGEYRVEGELAGLGQARRDPVTVLLGTSSKADLSIQAQIAEEITVTAAAPVVDATEPGLTSAVTESQIENLPLLGRDFKDLVLLTPGVTNTFGDRVSLNGGRGITTDYNIDGANANSDFFGEERGGTEAPFVFSQAAIKEFQVIRSSYSAEYARGVGGTMNAITKSGTNDFDGEVFYYHRDEDWADERSLTGIVEFFEPQDIDQYGFAVGGPILRDRLHFFANTDFQDKTEPFNFADIRADAQFLALPAETRAAFITRLEGLLGYSLDQEFRYDTRQDQETYMVKLDWNLNERHHLSVRDNYSDFNNFPSEAPSPFSNQGDEFNTVNSIVGELDSIFTNSLFNQFIVQHSLEERPIDPLTTSFPQTGITGGLSRQYFFGQRDFLPNGTDEDKLEMKDSLSYLWGEHQFKTGFNYLTVDIANLFVRDKSGDYRFNSVADFLANRPNRFEQGIGPGDGTNNFDFSQYGVFVMDTFRPIKNVTIDLGVRYDWHEVPVPTRNIYEATNPEFDDNFQEDDDNWAPRVGFAWDIKGDGRSVLRGGAGMYYNFMPAIILANPIAQISGIFTNYSFNCSATVQCPTYPNLFTREQLASANPTAVLDVSIVSPDLEAQESLRTSLGFEQQLWTSYSIGVEGVFSDIDKAQRFINVNTVPTGLVFGNVPQYNVTSPSRRYPNFQNVRMHVSDAEGEYKSATIQLKKLALRDSKLSWLAHYTWSEAIDQDSNERSTSTSFSLDPYHPELSEGRADYDITHKVVASATYELPYGFFVSGILNWRTGAPFTPFVDFPGSNLTLNNIAGVGVETPVFIDRDGAIIDLTAASNSTPQEFADFLAARGARIQERNSEDQPDFTNLDLRLAKRFGLFSGIELELIGEIFNVLNEENKFITSSNQEMFDIRIQSGRYIITRNANFGVPNGLSFASPPRQYQAAVKIHF